MFLLCLAISLQYHILLVPSQSDYGRNHYFYKLNPLKFFSFWFLNLNRGHYTRDLCLEGVVKENNLQFRELYGKTLGESHGRMTIVLFFHSWDSTVAFKTYYTD
jgi:hypothetical protein